MTAGRSETNPPWLGELVGQGIEAILAFDADLRAVYVNDAACELLGYGADDLLGIDVISLVHVDDLNRAAANIIGIGQGAQPDPGLLQVLRGDGTWHQYELRPQFIDLPGPPDGPGVLTAVSMRDNTMEDAHWLFLAQVASGADFHECIETFTTGLTSMVDGPMAVTYEADGVRHNVGPLPADLAWPEPIPPGSPWEMAVVTGEPAVCPIDDLPPALHSRAAALGIASITVVPVADPAHRTPACIVQGPYEAAMGDIVMIALSRRPKDALSIALERRDAMARLHEMAMSDPLTGLANRTSFFATLDELVDSQATFTICSVDLDNFKTINDTYGHQVGDAVLSVCARRLEKVARSGDLVARLGGDEFVVVHVGVGAELAFRVGQRLVDVLNQPADVGGILFDLGASVGVASSCDEANAAEVLAASDNALYDAKRAGRGTWRIAV